MKDLSVCWLLDTYGCLFSEKHQRMMNDYYNEDLSLSEISENENMTRQAAYDAIRRCEQQLRIYEEKLHYNRTVAELKEAAGKHDIERLLALIDAL